MTEPTYIPKIDRDIKAFLNSLTHVLVDNPELKEHFLEVKEGMIAIRNNLESLGFPLDDLGFSLEKDEQGDLIVFNYKGYVIPEETTFEQFKKDLDTFLAEQESNVEEEVDAEESPSSDEE